MPKLTLTLPPATLPVYVTYTRTPCSALFAEHIRRMLEANFDYCEPKLMCGVTKTCPSDLIDTLRYSVRQAMRMRQQTRHALFASCVMPTYIEIPTAMGMLRQPMAYITTWNDRGNKWMGAYSLDDSARIPPQTAEYIVKCAYVAFDECPSREPSEAESKRASFYMNALVEGVSAALFPPPKRILH